MQQEKKTRFDVYQIVTDQIIKKLEEGTAPWQKPWVNGRAPYNLKTGRPYRGINLLLLSPNLYELPAYLSFKQVISLKGSVKKGEKGHFVVYWASKIVEKDNEEPKKINVLRYYHVFNIEQCSNIPAKYFPEPRPPFDSILACEEVLYNMPKVPRIEHGGNRAFYNPAQDYIQMPHEENFTSPKTYYGTLFHELTHSTGHESRLNRKEVMDQDAFGSKSYSEEELVAEMGASYLKSFTGIAEDDFEQSTAYIQGWLEKLQNDKKFIFRASSKAQKAVDFILNTGQEYHEETAARGMEAE